MTLTGFGHILYCTQFLRVGKGSCKGSFDGSMEFYTGLGCLGST